MSICEELYHVYQKIVPTSGWLVNEEYEAKTFATIINDVIGQVYNYEDQGLQTIYFNIDKLFIDSDSGDFVYNFSFPVYYIRSGSDFLEKHKDCQIPAYIRPIIPMPGRLINLLDNTKPNIWKF